MGNYNPRVPYIMGEEWVPIRNEPVQFSNQSSDFESGYTMQLYGSEFVNNGRVYTQSPTPGTSQEPVFVSIYQQGRESGGVIQRLLIPVSAAAVTGAALTFNVTTSAAIVDALMPGNQTFLGFSQITPPVISPVPRVELYFPFNSYPILTGKRIVALNLVFMGVATNFGTNGPITSGPNPAFVKVVTSTNLANNDAFGSLTQWGMPNGLVDTNTLKVSKMPLGNFSTIWQNPQSGNAMPWNYTDLQRFEVTSPTRLAVSIEFNQCSTFQDTVEILSLQLEVLFCEETRLAVGGAILNPVQNMGANVVPLRDPTTRIATPLLTQGQYTVTATNGDMGAHGTGALLLKVPPWNALRELYSIPSHLGKQINITEAEGEQFTVATTHILPQISLHVTGGTLQEPHVYGSVMGVPVYNGVSPNQLLSDAQVALGSGAATQPFPWARFYARRFGNTQGSLVLQGTNPQITGSIVSVTPEQLDALPEIVDGWREITLRFPSIPTLGAISPDPIFQWSASETAANRWEILGVDAPAISGVPGSFIGLVRPADLLDGSTYAPTPLVGLGAPAVSGMALTWTAPPSGTFALDTSADAVFMLAQDPAAITGITISTLSQALTGFTDCSGGPCCIPSALQYNKITWTATGYGDAFNNRTVAPGGWGNLDTGQAWTITGDAGWSANDFSVANGNGLISVGAASVQHVASTGSVRDGEFTYDFIVPAYALGATFEVDLLARMVDKNNYYQFTALFQPNGRVDASILKNVAGSFTSLGSKTGAAAYTPGDHIRVRAQFFFTGAQCVLQMRVWNTSGTEQDAWDVQAFGDAAYASAGAVAVKAQCNAGNTNVFPLVFPINQFTFTQRPGMVSEVQRYDPVNAVWQTISRPAAWIGFFNDYEARVGVTSSYQIRSVDDLGFVSPWSITGTGTITEPGATMPACGANKRGMLFFTTNEDQTGASNLAYAMTFDSDNVETFSFLEANDATITSMLDRDYRMMFHGTERGGESFTRRLLIANAAVALPRLGNVRTLRDLAWHDYSYVCVRDDIGDRWLAAVIVTDDEVRRNRRLYNANITVIEVTATPTQLAVV
jgi:hypothetical protein